MAFLIAATAPPQSGAVIKYGQNGRWDAIFDIGYDPTIPISYQMGVHTYPNGQETEFGFCLIYSDMTGKNSGYTYKSSISNQIISRTERAAIFPLLKYYTAQILIMAKHKSFFMETFEDNLPVTALGKYDVLNHIFQSLGYSVSKVATTIGKHKWVMSL